MTRVVQWLAGLSVLLSACSGEPPRVAPGGREAASRSDRGSWTPVAVDSALSAEVEAFFRPHASGQRVHRPHLENCDPEVVAMRFTAISDFHLLGARDSGGLRVVDVEVRGVARQEFLAEPDHATRITVGPFTDTMTYEYRRLEGGVRTCGFSFDGEELGLFRTEIDSLTFWEPESASAWTLQRLQRTERLPRTR